MSVRHPGTAVCVMNGSLSYFAVEYMKDHIIFKLWRKIAEHFFKLYFTAVIFLKMAKKPNYFNVGI